MAQYMDAIDIASLGRRRHMDATTISSLMFAHWSDWFAYRAETRNARVGLGYARYEGFSHRICMASSSPVSPEDSTG